MIPDLTDTGSAIYLPTDSSGGWYSMSYFKRWVSRAGKDTLEALGWNVETVALGTLIAAGTLVLYFKYASHEDAMFEVQDILFAVVASVVVAAAFFLFNFAMTPSRLQAESDASQKRLETRLSALTSKQEHVDRLSEYLSDGIRDIWNSFPADATELAMLDSTWARWRTDVETYLAAHFTKSDLIHFSRLGVVPLIDRASQFATGSTEWYAHNKILREYAVKESRLREIIRDHNITHG